MALESGCGLRGGAWKWKEDANRAVNPPHSVRAGPPSPEWSLTWEGEGGGGPVGQSGPRPDAPLDIAALADFTGIGHKKVCMTSRRMTSWRCVLGVPMFPKKKSLRG